ncbi:MAG: cupin domain-containing protein [Rubripirellula sp.]|nr:cupin domain-containing protein [Rubripirellula sp.]
MDDVVDPRSVAESLKSLWAPRIVGEVDNAYVKVAKICGSLTWHAHEDDDEMFMVLRGQMQIEMEKQTVTLREGEFFVVPKGVRHNPTAEHECLILLFERKSTQHTGDVQLKNTRTIEQQLRQE